MSTHIVIAIATVLHKYFGIRSRWIVPERMTVTVPKSMDD